jgi:hypothetical protein
MNRIDRMKPIYALYLNSLFSFQVRGGTWNSKPEVTFQVPPFLATTVATCASNEFDSRPWVFPKSVLGVAFKS